MVKGWPDFTVPISIEAVTIETLPIDIKTQTLPVLKIDISTQSLEALNINILGGISNVKTVGRIVNPDFEEGEVAWVFYEGATVVGKSTGDQFYFGEKCCKFPYSPPPPYLYPHIIQSGITPTIDTNKISSMSIMAFCYGTSTGEIVLYYTDGSDESTVLNPVPMGWECFPVNFTAGKFICAVEVWGYPNDVYSPFYVDGFFINFKIDDYVGTTSTVNLNVNIAASAVTLNVAIQSSAVTLNVNIQSQTVDINIKTSGGANIIIDKLTQTAIAEDRRELATDNGTLSAYYAQLYRGKFFARGCLSFLDYIAVYLRNTDGSSHKLYIKIAVHPRLGWVFEQTYIVPANTPAGWYLVYPRIPWLYESMFVCWYTDHASLQVGRATGGTADGWNATDWSTMDWIPHASDVWMIRLNLKALSVGAVPVTGILNTIQIPSTSDTRLASGIELTTDAETTIKTVYGAGEVQQLIFTVDAATDSHKVTFRVYCDGNLAMEWTFEALKFRGYMDSSPCIQLLVYAENGRCHAQTDVKLTFRRELKITYHRMTGAPNTMAYLEGVVNLIR